MSLPRATAALVILMLASGWLPEASPPASVVCAAPPLAEQRSLHCEWRRLSVVVARTGSWRSSLDFVQASRLLGLEAPARRVLAAALRKTASGSVLAALHELDRVVGRSRRGTSALPASASPGALHYSIGRFVTLLSTAPLEAMASVGTDLERLLASGEPEGLHPRTRILLDRVIGLVDRRRARRSAWKGWRTSRDPASRSIRTDLALSLAAMSDHAGHRAAWTRRSLASRLRVAGAPLAYPAIRQLSAFDRTATGPLGLDCRALDPVVEYLRFDCGLASFEGAWARRDLDRTLEAYRRLSRVGGPKSGVAALRAAPSMLTFLRLVDADADFRAMLSEARQAAASLGQDELLARLAAEESAFHRSRGRLERAREALDRVTSANVTAGVAIEHARVHAALGQEAEVSPWLDRAASIAAGESRPPQALLLARAELDPSRLRPEDWRLLIDTPVGPGVNRTVWKSAVAARRALARGATSAAYEHQIALLQSLLGPGRVTGLQRILVESLLHSSPGLLTDALPVWDTMMLSERSATGEPAKDLRHLAEDLRPSDLVLVVRAVGERVVLWIIDSETAAMRLSPVEAGELTRRLELLAALLRSSGIDDSWRALAANLREVLLAPDVRERVRGSERLFAVIDPRLSIVPIDVLLGSPWTGRPPAVAHVNSLATLHTAWHQPRRAGVTTAFLPGLTAASRREARTLRSKSRAEVFAGAGATESALREAITSTRILHFGGHSVPPRSILEEGGLDLRERTGRSWSRLGSSEIERLSLRGALVVLMGCDTVSAEPSAFAARPLAESFLRAGSRAVVGNLWTIGDGEAAALAEVFYSEGGPEGGPEALARTKERMRRLFPDNPAAWAGLVWHGAPPD